ncbi:MAG: hypothetical protein AAF745_17690, partial [Planctomycetota bacterium]
APAANNPPAAWNQPSWTPQAKPPIEETIASPFEKSTDKPRSLQDALRPLGGPPASERFETRQSPPNPSELTAPAESESRAQLSRENRVRRENLDVAEAFNKQRQTLFDRAQLAKSVPFRFSNSNRFSLEYELEAVASSGVQSVELYGSLDAGRTWKRWGADPDVSSPFDIETKGEGVFAYRIVVLGNNGLASPRPLSGDNPDIAVIVDQTLPKIRITSARYGEGDRTGSLVIRYECSDENLMTRPVSIAFSDSLDGPWTTIASGLRNDGLYVWPADPKLPPQIFLRVDATDQAGNQGSYLLEQPIATGGLAPRAKILGFRPR